MPDLPMPPTADAPASGGKVILNEYGTPIVVEPEPPIQGPAQGPQPPAQALQPPTQPPIQGPQPPTQVPIQGPKPPTQTPIQPPKPSANFAEDDYGDQIIDFGKSDAKSKASDVDMYDPTNPTAEPESNFAADGEPLLDGIRVDELPAVRLRQELLERQLDHRGPIQTLVQRLRMTLSIENKCKQMMKQKIAKAHSPSPAAAAKKDDPKAQNNADDGDEEDEDDDDDDDSPAINPMSMASIMGVFRPPEVSSGGGGGEEDMEIEEDEASGDALPAPPDMPDIPLPSGLAPLLPPPPAPPALSASATALAPPPPAPPALSSSTIDSANPPGEDLAMLGIDPQSVEPTIAVKPPPALSASSAAASSSPLSSPIGSPESHSAAQQPPITGSSIFNVFFNAGKSPANGSVPDADKSDDSESQTNGSGLGKRLDELRVVDLKAELEKRELATTGNKTVLLSRLRGAIQSEGADPDSFLFE